MSRWLSFGHLLLLSQIIFTLRSCVIPGLSGNLLRQRLQHRALAASQPCTGKCALTLQPTAAFHHRHPRLRPGILSCLWQGARRAPWGWSSPQRPAAGDRIFRRRAKIRLSPRGTRNLNIFPFLKQFLIDTQDVVVTCKIPSWNMFTQRRT